MSLSDWSHSATHTPSVILSDRPEPKFGKKDLECCFSRKLVRVQNGNISLFVYLSLKKPWYIHIHTLFNLVVRVAKASPLIHPLFISPGHVPTTRVWLQFPIVCFFLFAHPRPGNGWFNRAKIPLLTLFSVRSSNFVDFHVIFGFKFTLYYRFNRKTLNPPG